MRTHDYDPDTETLDCRHCGLPHEAHLGLADHPEEAKLRGQEAEASTTLNRLSQKAAKALKEHNRVEAVVLLTQLTVMADRLRLGMHKAIDDQMKAARKPRDPQP